MPVPNIYYHPQFRKSFLNLTADLQSIAKEKIILFKHNPFDVSLETHKLHGKLKNHWSFTVKGRYRVVFIFIGPHDIYK